MKGKFDANVKFGFSEKATKFKKNLRRLFHKYAVARTEHDAFVKSKTMMFQNTYGLYGSSLA